MLYMYAFVLWCLVGKLPFCIHTSIHGHLVNDGQWLWEKTFQGFLKLQIEAHGSNAADVHVDKLKSHHFLSIVDWVEAWIIFLFSIPYFLQY